MNMQKKEKETLKERTVTLRLTDDDCKRLMNRCSYAGMSVPELLEQFIADLTGGAFCNGSDECELVTKWYFRSQFCPCNPANLIQWTAVNLYGLSSLSQLLEDIESAVECLKDYEINPERYDDEEIIFCKEDLLDWQDELRDIKTQYMHDNPLADWDREVEIYKKWYHESFNFLNLN